MTKPRTLEKGQPEAPCCGRRIAAYTGKTPLIRREHMWAKRFAKGALLAAAAVFIAAAPTRAAELAGDSFDVPMEGAGGSYVDGRAGLGWTQSGPEVYSERLDYAVSLEGIDQGILSFDLKRLGDGNEISSIISLLNASDEKLLVIKIDWQSSLESGAPMVYLKGRPYIENGLGLWGLEIPLNLTIAEGQWARFDFAWDDSAKRYDLYVNGKAQETAARQYNSDGSFMLDPRILLNGEPGPDRYPLRPFEYILSQITNIRVGSNSDLASIGGEVIDNLVFSGQAPFGNMSARERNVRDLSAGYMEGGVHVKWSTPELYGVNQGYVVYRRDGTEGNSRFEKLTDEPVYGLSFTDSSAVPSAGYRYSVASVYGDLKGGVIEGKYAPEVAVTAASVAIASVAAEKAVYAGGEKLLVTLKGTADCAARFSVAGVAADVPMTEVDGEVYVGSFALPAGLNAETSITASLDPASGNAVTVVGPKIKIDSIAPDMVRNIIATAGAGEISLGWTASASRDVEGYRIYRGQGSAPDLSGAQYDYEKGLGFVDVGAVAGIKYSYQVVPVDAAGNLGEPSDVVSSESLRGEGPAISSIVVDSGGKPARPAEKVSLSVAGQSGGTVTVSIDGIAEALALTEAGRTGVYARTLEVLPEHVQVETAAHAVVAKLCDAYGCSELGGAELLIIGENDLNDTVPPVISSATNNGFQAAGFSGKLVAGDNLTITAEGEAGCNASFILDNIAEGVLTETRPGVYSGIYTVDFDDDGDEVAVRVALTDNAGNSTEAMAGKPVAFDTRVRIVVNAENAMLRADSKSKTKISARAENANGDDVSGQELQFTLTTTDEYTGVVGGGDIEGNKATKDDEDDLDVKWGGITDAFGEVKADYTAGNAAKTALLVVKNVTNGDVGVGWLNTYITSSVSIELISRTNKNALDQALLALTATPAALTADGRSKSRIKAVLKDLDGKPIANQSVAFTLAGDNGKLKALHGSRTDADGVAEADYRAGTSIGTVTISVAVPDYGVTSAVKIVLMSDAPANIDLVSSATQLVADGKSTADLSVLVSDVNGNPNEGALVSLEVTDGSGAVDKKSFETDRNGEGSAVYTAGTRAGTAVIEARHTSRAPTPDELRRAHGTVFVPRLSDKQERDRIKIAEWLVDGGDEVEKGQPLVVLESRKGTWTLNAPAKGVLAAIKRFKKDRVELGDSLGYVEIDEEVWEKEY